MTNKRRADKHAAYQNLSRNGIDLQKHNQVRPNPGSETFKHLVAKAAVAHIAINNGYWVSSEVETPHGEIDCLLWGNPDRITYAVECGVSPTDDVISDKLDRYVKQQSGVQELVVVNVSEMPTEMLDALDYVSDQLGLDP